jgi:hypothetical protein
MPRPKPLPITKPDIKVQARYQAARPDPLGNLHERMKAVLERAQEIGLWRIDDRIWQHLHDLQLELMFHEPADPPFGQRKSPYTREEAWRRRLP